jgi:hypothetical protein
MKHLLPILLGIFIATFARADDAQVVTLASWGKNLDAEALEISVRDQITKKQKSIITGGFTTLSQLSLKLQNPNGGAVSTEPFFVISCSVKYDAWEEYFDVAVIADTPKTALLKSFDEYAALCLHAELLEAEVLKKFAPSGGTVVAELAVKQTSIREANQIKDELIKSQSGIMQQLFAHMLGELVLSQSLSVRVSIPPHPQGKNIKFRAIKDELP